MDRPFRSSFYFLIAALFALAATAVRAQSSNVFSLTPTNVSASAVNYDQISVSWTAPSNAANLAGYYVYRNGAQVANTAGTSFIDTVSPGAAYSYTVSGYDAVGDVSPNPPLPRLSLSRKIPRRHLRWAAFLPQ